MDTESPGPDSIEWLGTQYRTLIDQKTSGGAISVPARV